MLFGVNTPGGPWKIVFDVGLDPPQRQKKVNFLILGPPHSSGTAEATALKFSVLVNLRSVQEALTKTIQQ